ncbi:hypothetical protein NPIL_646441 [Nephila pilipes]|uniref:Uncharacterized protein n=1 Tax=Nephila pilipes TaxID=299642 RepID=A0A8X6QXZ6_NEPPI|nr:hypothetical protein NPIL_646441 [Nephila pilipes]
MVFTAFSVRPRTSGRTSICNRSWRTVHLRQQFGNLASSLPAWATAGNGSAAAAFFVPTARRQQTKCFSAICQQGKNLRAVQKGQCATTCGNTASEKKRQYTGHGQPVLKCKII